MNDTFTSQTQPYQCRASRLGLGPAPTSAVGAIVLPATHDGPVTAVVLPKPNDRMWIIGVPCRLAQPFVVLVADDEKPSVAFAGFELTMPDADLRWRSRQVLGGVLRPGSQTTTGDVWPLVLRSVSMPMADVSSDDKLLYCK